MGKAIISTPFVNEMPEKMVHGENIYFVETESEMIDAVNILLSDHKLREKLEIGAKDYYNKWLKPDIVIRRIINELQLKQNSSSLTPPPTPAVPAGG
ncbi:glycosyltransferase involved in cell wall biosynthesis [Microbacter margulisiae]|uniref:Glycosyltransferase involved in cell wall biosynthesis n=2 Tax=Microbacter margulisiae TaxID=1350067 RepID=A0A7W5DN96_9PORP|nr:glycosyltransferase [Microbacter margulisiae]MBB3185981.1 glycosyltransferase involved in cell wall biosynthesis [Microbacter margulisiae]